MDYQEVLDYMYSQLPMYQRIGGAAYKHDLSKTLELDKHFGHPHRKFRSVHIAGTNGKGTVAHSLASILQEAGYKVGLYTSPHYLDFRERIKINNQKIPKQYVVDFIQYNKNYFQRIKPSFFEMTVMMAFKYFADQNVDIAIIEVGMGGRLDSTNIIRPLVSVITNIGYDHMQFLGNSLVSIANEKAGIIKPKVPVVLGPMSPMVRNVFLEKAAQLDCQIFLSEHIFSIANAYITSNNKLAFSVYKNGKLYYKNMTFGLTGMYQLKNIPVILQTIEVLKQYPYYHISQQALYKGMANVQENTGIMGRWQLIRRKPLIIADAGHNQDGIKAVTEQLTKLQYRQLHMVFGVVNDKDLTHILPLLPKNAVYYFVKSSVPRAKDSRSLQTEALAYGLNGLSFDTVAQGLEQALKLAHDDDLIFIGGSTFVVADALKFFGF